MNPTKARMRAWLKRHGMTQASLCAELSISPAHLSQILSGTRTPSLELAFRLQERTGISARSFLPIEETVAS